MVPVPLIKTCRVEDDDEFDPNGTTKALNDNDADNDSDASSKATLGELSIELKIGRQELDDTSISKI